MKGRGPYLWINKYAPAAGFHTVPYGGMCIGVFLFVKRGRTRPSRMSASSDAGSRRRASQS